MKASYKKLWKLLVDKEMSKGDLHKACFVMSYLLLRKGLTPRSCKIHLAPSMTAISS